MTDEDRRQDHQSLIHPMECNGGAPPSLLCPSAQPEMTDSVVFGVVGGSVERPCLAYLVEPQPVTNDLLALSEPVKPTEVFRFAAPCAGHACQHFDGSDCRLVSRVIQLLPVVVERLSPCRLRPRCRWWQQEGKEACLRCPQIVTENYRPSEQARRAAMPEEKSLEHKRTSFSSVWVSNS